VFLSVRVHSLVTVAVTFCFVSFQTTAFPSPFFKSNCHIKVVLLVVVSLLSYFEKVQLAYEITLLSVCVCLCIPPSLLGNGSVKVLLSLLSNDYVFYAVRVVSKESRPLVLHKTSCEFLLLIQNISLYFIFYIKLALLYVTHFMSGLLNISSL
jgi:hypothetical protein